MTDEAAAQLVGMALGAVSPEVRHRLAELLPPARRDSPRRSPLVRCGGTTRPAVRSAK